MSTQKALLQMWESTARHQCAVKKFMDEMKLNANKILAENDQLRKTIFNLEQVILAKNKELADLEYARAIDSLPGASVIDWDDVPTTKFP